MNEDFEKAFIEYESKHLIGASGLVRKIGSHFYAVRQPEIDALKAENERLRKDAERWGFCRDNKNFRYFRNSGVWEILGQDRSALIEGRATTYQDAVDAAIAAMKETK